MRGEEGTGTRASCVGTKCKFFLCSSLQSGLTSENGFLFGHFLTEELARLPRSRSVPQDRTSVLTDGLHHIPTGWEGELDLGRGPVFALPLNKAAGRVRLTQVVSST